MVGSYPLMAISLAGVVEQIRIRPARWRVPAWLLLFTLVALNLFQSYQYLRNIVHRSGMTREAYFAVWGATSPVDGLEELLLVDRIELERDTGAIERYAPTKAVGRFHGLLFTPIGQPFDTAVVETLEHFILGPDAAFSPAIRTAYADLTRNDHAILELRWFIRPSSADLDAAIVCTFEHEGNYAYRKYPLHEFGLVQGKWNQVAHTYITPEVRDPQDPFTTYLWSMDGRSTEVVGPLIVVHERRGSH
jgi:hypothetical protein